MRHPLHQQHFIEAIHPISIYAEYNGAWQCDNCSTQYGSQEIPYHCKECGYDLCNSCYQPKSHFRHPHNLYLAKMTLIYPQFQGQFKCDACEVNKGEMAEDALAYHCFDDQFDMCKECFLGKNFVIHIHPLMPVNAAVIYNNSPGLWVCDTCRRSGTDMNTNYSWHCSQCEFDCCRDCLKSVRVNDHDHPLMRTDPFVVYSEYQGHWKCDKCSQEYPPGARSENKPYHCSTCGYDMCQTCYHNLTGGLESDQSYDVTGPPASAFLVPDFNHPKRVHQPPVEIADNDDTLEENLDDSQKCIVCYGRPKNATIVHGPTGHVCCCLSCAYTLQRRGDSCPICRAPIDRVIKHYTS